MKSLKSLLSPVLVVLLLTTCTQSEIELQFEEVREIIAFDEDEKLSELIGKFGTFSSRGRTTFNFDETEIGDLVLDRISKTHIDPNKSGAHYSIPISSTSLLIKEWLVLEPTKDGYVGYILQYEFTRSFDLINFTGFARVLDLDRNIQSEDYLENGVQIEKDNTNGRPETTYTNCDCEWETRESPVNGPITGSQIGTDTEVWLSCQCEEANRLDAGDSAGGGGLIDGGGIGTPVEGGGGRIGGGPSSGGSGGTIGVPSECGASGGFSGRGGNCTNNEELFSIIMQIENDLDKLSFSYLRDRYAPRMSPKELAYFDNNLTSAQKILYLQNAYRADETTEYFDPNYYGGSNNEWDAMRHAYFQGLNSQNMGTSVSKILGDLHEDHPNNPALEKKMDLFNNQVGRDTFTKMKSEGLAGHFYREGLLIRLLDTMNSGGLKEIINGKLVPTP